MFEKKKRWSQKTSNRNTVKNREIHAMIHTVDWIESIFDTLDNFENYVEQFERNGTTLCCQKVPNSGEGWFLLFQHCNTHRFYRIFTIYDCTRFSLFFSDRIDFHFLDKRAKWKSSKRRSLHTDARTFDEPGMSDMIDDRHNCPKIVNVRKNVNVHADLCFAFIYASLNCWIWYLPTCPNPRYSITKFEKQRQLHADAEAPTHQRSDATQQGGVKVKRDSNCVWPSHVQIYVNLRYDNHSLPDSTLPMR